MKSVCMFCMKEHKTKRPALCIAKGDILKEYLKHVKARQVFVGIESGTIDLEGEALKLVKRRKESHK